MSAEKREREENSYCHKCGKGEFDIKDIIIEGKVVATKTICVNCGELIEAEAVKQ